MQSVTPNVLKWLATRVALLLALAGPFACTNTSRESPMFANLKASIEKKEAALQSAVARLPVAGEYDSSTAALAEELINDTERAVREARELLEQTRSEALAWDIIEWILSKDVQSSDAAKAIDVVVDRKMSGPRTARILAILGREVQSPKLPTYLSTTRLLHAAMASSETREIRAEAAFALVQRAVREFQFASQQRADVEGRIAIQQSLIEVIEKYGDCEDHYRRDGGKVTTISETAGRLLSSIQEIAVGEMAPNLDGVTVEGGRISRADLAAEVHLVVFWATWCGPCMAEIPDEIRLSQKFYNRGFRLIGVNCDSELAKAQAAVDSHSIPWQSLWNGPGGKIGPITDSWHVNRWPATFLVGADGKIRAIDLRGKELEDAIVTELGNNDFSSGVGR